MIVAEDALCLACGGALEASRKIVRLRGAHLISCRQCRSWNYFPRASATGQIALHDDDDYFTHPYFENRQSQQERVDVRCRDLFAALAGVPQAPDPRGARVLDIGCGGGELLESARRQFGVDPTGLDVARYAVKQLQEKGIPAIHGVLGDVPAASRFDIVLAIDVIEHVLDPCGFIADIAARLAPGGVAFLETPNHFSLIYGVGRLIANATGGWPPGALERLFPPHHVVYLSRAALTQAVAASGLELVRFYSRTLQMLDIGGSNVLRAGLGSLQLFDHLTGQRALNCMLLRKID